MANRVSRHDREWLDTRHIDSPHSFVAWKVEQNNNYVDASLTLADCTRRIDLGFNDVGDLSKLAIIREHLDKFERAARQAFRQRHEEERNKA